MDISDAELRNRLIAKGFNPPPVTDTSRLLLLKKLKKLEASAFSASVNGGGGGGGGGGVSVNNASVSMNSSSVGGDQYDGRSRKSRYAADKMAAAAGRDSSPEIITKSMSGMGVTNSAMSAAAAVAADNYRSVSGESSSGSGSGSSTTRVTRNSRKDGAAVAGVGGGATPIMAKVKTSTPYAAADSASFAKGDPFEKGSDSDDSLYSGRIGSRYLARKPIGGVRRESEFYTAPVTAYRRYDGINGSGGGGGGGLAYSSPALRSGSNYVRYNRHRVAGTGGVGLSVAAILRKANTPTVVLAACLVFFVVVGGIYYTKNDRTYGELSTDVVDPPKCSVRGRQGVSCVPDKDIPETIEHLKVLYRALYKRKLNSVCHNNGSMAAGTTAAAGGAATASRGKSGAVPYVADNEAIEMLVLESGLLRFEAEKMVKNMRVLATANPPLKIVCADGRFELEEVELPWSCRVRLLSALLWYYVLYVILTVTFVLSIHLLWMWWTARREQRAKEKQSLVKGVLEVLQQNAVSNASRPYLPVVHVRDQLISFADRDRKRKMWDETVRYVEENESRVRKEIQPFEGEDYDVWRWVGGGGSGGGGVSGGIGGGSGSGGGGGGSGGGGGLYQLSASVPPKPKTWQGEAFETSKDTMNTPSTSPTPCLKIRHMFDPKKEAADEDWGTRVKDAILERCEGVNIVHMVVDETSTEGCVYAKCASAEDAGKAYRKIHGVWFDGMIVTVKYLRLERYHERFPASVGLTKPLMPSNDQKRSLA